MHRDYHNNWIIDLRFVLYYLKNILKIQLVRRSKKLINKKFNYSLINMKFKDIPSNHLRKVVLMNMHTRISL